MPGVLTGFRRLARASCPRKSSADVSSSLSPKQIFGSRRDLVRLEAELFLKFFERSRSPEGAHADAAAFYAHIALPPKSRGLFHGHSCLDCRREDTIAVLLALILEDFPGGH